jgi:hypothetical protein
MIPLRPSYFFKEDGCNDNVAFKATLFYLTNKNHMVQSLQQSDIIVHLHVTQ